MYAIIRNEDEDDHFGWLVVAWTTGPIRFPMDLTRRRCRTKELLVRQAMDAGKAGVIARCIRRDDARILTAELRRREREQRQRVLQATLEMLAFAGEAS